GERMWGDSSKLIQKGKNNTIFSSPLMVSDGEGGVLVHYRHEWNYFFERIDNEGETIWITPSTYLYNNMISVGNGGAVTSGVKRNPLNFNDDMFANYISSEGGYKWGNEGILLQDSVGSPLASAGFEILDTSEIIFVWTRKVESIRTILTQIVSFTGNKKWLFPKRINNNTSDQFHVGLVKSDSNNVIYVWFDSRNNNPCSYDIYTQRIDTNGFNLWDNNDLPLTYKCPFKYKIISDKSKGAIVIWSDDEPFNGIFAQQISKDGNLGEVITSINDNNEQLVSKNYLLFQNYPNPFNPSTFIQFGLPKREFITLKIFNVLGQEVATLIGKELGAGSHKVEFKPKELTSGIYIYTLSAGEFQQSKKLIYLK
ncbi:MAG: T9SS type A sorting domain-containing protein, partial [Bacteroidetes bacterium]|nr:T9SS type A sorting domain-containing protein [Bacteroidota bacterium]